MPIRRKRPRWPAYERCPPDQITHPLMVHIIQKHNQIIELEEELRRRPQEIVQGGFSLERVQRLVDLAVERAGARAHKDYARADELRGELRSAGLVIRDA